MFSIGELSERSGVKVVTIRYYEKSKLLDPAPRTAGGQRRYRDEDAQRLLFIRSLRELGFEVDEIRSLIALDTPGGMPPADRTSSVGRFAAATEMRLRRLDALRTGLLRLASADSELTEGELLMSMAGSI
jgi:DNA-binding transcriptional MerR regulator